MANYKLKAWSPKGKTWSRYYIVDENGNQTGDFIFVNTTTTQRKTSGYYEAHRAAKGDTDTYKSTFEANGKTAERVMKAMAETEHDKHLYPALFTRFCSKSISA